MKVFGLSNHTKCKGGKAKRGLEYLFRSIFLKVFLFLLFLASSIYPWKATWIWIFEFAFWIWCKKLQKSLKYQKISIRIRRTMGQLPSHGTLFHKIDISIYFSPFHFQSICWWIKVVFNSIKNKSNEITSISTKPQNKKKLLCFAQWFRTKLLFHRSKWVRAVIK